MGTWGTDIFESDSFEDVYGSFIDHYNNGDSPEVASRSVRDELAGYFVDYDDKYDAHFALAYAQWETQSLKAPFLSEVTKLVTSGADMKNWEARGASESDVKARRKATGNFLKKIGKTRPARKRRDRRSFDFSEHVLISLSSPDGAKTFTIAESYVNGKYIHTGAVMMWDDGGGSVFHVETPELKYSANWVDSQNLKICIPKFIENDIKKNPTNNLKFAFFCGDRVTLHCEFI